MNEKLEPIIFEILQAKREERLNDTFLTKLFKKNKLTDEEIKEVVEKTKITYKPQKTQAKEKKIVKPKVNFKAPKINFKTVTIVIGGIVGLGIIGVTVLALTAQPKQQKPKPIIKQSATQSKQPKATIGNKPQLSISRWKLNLNQISTGTKVKMLCLDKKGNKKTEAKKLTNGQYYSFKEQGEFLKVPYKECYFNKKSFIKESK